MTNGLMYMDNLKRYTGSLKNKTQKTLGTLITKRGVCTYMFP